MSAKIYHICDDPKHPKGINVYRKGVDKHYLFGHFLSVCISSTHLLDDILFALRDEGYCQLDNYEVISCRYHYHVFVRKKHIVEFKTKMNQLGFQPDTNRTPSKYINGGAVMHAWCPATRFGWDF